MDIVDHKNGYLAHPYDPVDLAYGLDWVLRNPEYDTLAKNARQKAVEKFDFFVVADQYHKLYEKLIKI